MVITTPDDVQKISALLDLHPQIIAEAVLLSTKEDILCKTQTSFDTLREIFLGAPCGSTLKRQAFERLSLMDKSEKEWQEYTDLTRPPQTTPPSFSQRLSRNFDSFCRWVEIFFINPRRIYRIRKAWNEYRRTVTDLAAQKRSLNRVIELL